MRTNLDGSHLEVVMSDGLDTPNGVAVANNNIFIIDSFYKESSSRRNGALFVSDTSNLEPVELSLTPPLEVI